MFRSVAPILTAAAAAMLVSGCATKNNLVEQATKANLVFEDAGNRIMLLNAVRAYKHRPMYFSSITKMSSPLGAGRISGSASFGLGRDVVNDILTLTPQYTPDSPGFDMQPWDQQKFFLGFSKTVTPSLVSAYIERGWPQELMLALFVRQIIETVGDKQVAYWNYPEREADFRKFTGLIETLSRGCIAKLENVAPPMDIGLAVSGSSAKLAELVAVAKEGLTLVETRAGSGQWRVRKAGDPDQQFRFVQQPQLASQANVEKCAATNLKVVESPSISPPLASAAASAPASTAGAAEAKAADAAILPADQSKPAKKVYTAQLRSPEQIVYYLGELIRAQLRGPYAGEGDDRGKKYVPTVGIGPKAKPTPIFVVVNDDAAKAAVTASYDGERYSIPDDEKLSGRSMQVLSLVSELIGLQKEATELTPTTNIRFTPQ